MASPDHAGSCLTQPNHRFGWCWRHGATGFTNGLWGDEQEGYKYPKETQKKKSKKW